MTGDMGETRPRPIRRSAATLALLAVASLTLVLPLLVAFTPVSHRVWMWIVAAGYAVVAVSLGRPRAGLALALVVTTTSAFTIERASLEYLRTTPGWLGPTLWLVHVPLVLFTGVLVYRMLRARASSLSPVEAVLGGYVVWTSLSIIFTDVPRPDTAFYYTLLILQGWIVLLAVRRSVIEEWVSFEEVVFALVAAVVGHTAAGLSQLLNQGVFGLWDVGEISRGASNPDAIFMTLGPLRFNVGLFVSGFTGNAYVLAALIALVGPIVLAAVVRTHGWRRVGALLAFGLLAVVLRSTNSDGARGAFLLGTVLLAGWLLVDGRRIAATLRARLVTDRDASGSRRPQYRSVVSATGAVLAAAFVGFSSTSRANGSAASGAAGAAAGSAASSVPSQLPLPSFSLGSLAPRLEQYVVAADLFTRHPVFGIGGGNFQYYGVLYGIPEGTALHNIYLILLVETGLPGFLLYALALLLVYRAGWRLVRERSVRTTLVVAVLVGMTGYLAYGFWDHLALDRITAFLPFWVLAGALVGAYARHVVRDGQVDDWWRQIVRGSG